MTAEEDQNQRIFLREKAMILNEIAEYLYGEGHFVGDCTSDQREEISRFLLATLSKERRGQISEELYQAKVVDGWRRLAATQRRIAIEEWVRIRACIAEKKAERAAGAAP